MNNIILIIERKDLVSIEGVEPEYITIRSYTPLSRIDVIEYNDRNLVELVGTDNISRLTVALDSIDSAKFFATDFLSQNLNGGKINFVAQRELDLLANKRREIDAKKTVTNGKK